MANFKEIIKTTLENEGGYSNDELDSGGETYCGISRNNFPNWDGWKIIDANKGKLFSILPELNSKVEQFYYDNFWMKIKGNDILSNEKAKEIFDFAVNAGVSSSVKIAQLVLKVEADGVMGVNTLSALNSFNSDVFVLSFKIEKVRKYVSIVDKNPTQLKYLKGWIKRAIS